MVKLIDPLHSVEARGSMADTTYNTWRGIRYAKARAGPTTQYSDKQIAARAATAVCTAAWRALSTPERTAWNAWADAHPLQDWTGEPHRHSGYNWYVKVNWLPAYIGDGPNPNPPVYPRPDVLHITNIVWNPPDLSIEFTPVTGPPGGVAIGMFYWYVRPLDTRVPRREHAHLVHLGNLAWGDAQIFNEGTGWYYIWARVQYGSPYEWPSLWTYAKAYIDTA